MWSTVPAGFPTRMTKRLLPYVAMIPTPAFYHRSTYHGFVVVGRFLQIADQKGDVIDTVHLEVGRRCGA